MTIDFTWLPLQASKAALVRFFETLRVELSPDIKITIVFPGVISTDMTTPHFVEKVNNNTCKQFQTCIHINLTLFFTFFVVYCTIQYGSDFFLSESVTKCAKAIFRGIARGETYIEEPSWLKWMFLINSVTPEMFDYLVNYLFFRYLKPYFKRD